MSDQNKISITISADDKASPEVKKFKAELEAIGKIKAFRELKRQTAESLQQWKNAQAGVAGLARAMKSGGEDAGRLKAKFEAAKKETVALKAAYVANRNGLHDLRKALSAAGVDVKNLSAEQIRLRESTARAKEVLSAQRTLGVRPYRAVQAEIGKLRQAYDTLKKSGTVASADLIQAKAKLRTKTAELRRETGSWTEAIGQARAGLLGLAAAGYGVIRVFRSYSEFTQRMAEVNTLVETSREEFAGLSDEIRQMTRRIPQSASQLAAAQYDILSAGVALEKSTRVLELSARAAVAGVTDTKTAANAGIGVINAYGKSIDKLDEIYDLLFQTVKSGVTTFPQLAQHIGEVLPTARAADVQFSDVAAAIAAMTKAGIRTPQAATALKGAINAMSAPAPEARKQFEALGITWEGLIPTLDAIRKKGLTIDQLRLLIPDVEARTGVLALTQNFDGLLKILDQMDLAAGATGDAYDKMAKTPANQLKLLTNEIEDLAISGGALISTVLLPLAKGLRLVVDGMREADPVTKTLIYTLMSAAGGFAIWKLGLGAIVLGLRGMIAKTVTAQAAAGNLTAQLSSAGVAMKVGLAASALYGAVNIVRLGQAIYQAVDAYKSMKAAQGRLLESADQVKEKYAEFADLKLPSDLTKLSREDLEKWQQDLRKARAYYVALKSELEEKAKKSFVLGLTSDEAIEAQKQLRDVNGRLAEIQEGFSRVREAAASAGADMARPAEAVAATAEQLDEFEKKAKAAYEEAKKEAADYAKQVIEWEEKIKYARLSTEDKIRELGRKGLAEAEQWADKKLQAEEKLYAAKRAMAEGDYQLAEKLAKEAEGLYADLATEVKGTEKGNEVVVKSLEETKKVAINGVTEVGSFVEQLYTLQRDAAASAEKEWSATAEGIQAQLEAIAKEREANVKIQLKGLEAAQSAINALVKDETKHITVVTRRREEKAAGGLAGLAAGGKLPGYGGGDRIRALLEAGEFVIRKEAVKKYGAALFSSLNAMRLDLPDLVRARLGGMIGNISIPAPRFAFAEGGAVSAAAASGETMTLRLAAGDTELPLRVMGSARVTRKMVKEFESELIKMGLSKR